MASIQLGGKIIGNSRNEIYIIAEIGQNHQGSVVIAKQMILEAKKAGCNCVKFQKSCLTAKFTKSALNRRYDGENSWGKTYGEHKEYLEFTLEEYKELQKFSHIAEIDFTASAMDEVSLQFLDALDVPFIKIGSGDANNFPMLQEAAKLRRPLVVSTGMQTMKTIFKIVQIMKETNKTNYALLHCVSSYPTKPSDCNLQMISLLKNRFPDVVIGYSGHELGIQISKVAVLLGAKILERHFTLDKKQKGSDHKCSLESTELKQLVREIDTFKYNGVLKREISAYEPNAILDMFQNEESVQLALKKVIGKVILPCEVSCKRKLGKSIIAARNLQCGHKLESTDICIKVSEPNGIPGEEYEVVLGAELLEDIEGNNPIMFHHIILTTI